MNNWNYRLLRHQIDDYLELVEVFYSDDGELAGWCPAHIGGDTEEECKAVMKMMQEAFKQPPIDEKEFDIPEES